MRSQWIHYSGRLGLLLLIGLLASCGDNPAGGGTPCNHLDVDGLEVAQGDSVVASQWQGTVTGGFTVAPGTSVDDLLVTWINADSTAVVFNPGCDLGFELRWTIANSGIAAITQGASRWSFGLHGLSAGMTTVRLRSWHGDHADFSSLEFPIQVTTAASVEPQVRARVDGRR
jgi:hypothetical protein